MSEESYTYSGFGTKCIHSGQEPDPTTGAVIIPISLSTTFQQESPGVHKGFEYSRSDNPTRRAFELNVADLENGKWGLAFSSGSATTSTIIQMLNPGDHVVAMNDLYGGTYRYFTKVAERFKIEFDFVDLTETSNFENKIKSNTKLLWIETPTNPLLKLVDIKALSALAHEKNIIVIVDNTFMSPYFQKPLDLGADIVVHSVTKYLNGHSDLVMGVAVGINEELHAKLKFLQNSIGAVPSAFDCFLGLRGIKTLHVRMKQHEENAKKIVEYLVNHKKVEKVIYPGLESHPQHELAKTQMSGFGGMITFYVKGGIKESRQFLENLDVWALAESLGGVESLVDHPVIMTHASVPLEERLKNGILDNLVRLSCGIEDSDDLIKGLEKALSFVTSD